MVARNRTADVIVIGGGVAGLSTAMQLAQRGVSVLVLERQRIGNGSTGRAAGLLGQLRGTAEHTRMLKDGVAIVKDLESRTGTKIFVQTGSLLVADTPERIAEIRHLVVLGKSVDFEIDHLSVQDVAGLAPYMKTDNLLDACYAPTDGYLRPAELVAAYVEVGKQLGVRFVSDCPVERIGIAGGRPDGVLTPQGEFSAPVLVNAAGPWSYLLADLVKQTLPTAALRHFYLTTQPRRDPAVDPRSPAIRDRGHRIYSRPDGGGLTVGYYGEKTTLCDMTELSPDFDMSTMTLARDDPSVTELIAAAQQRFPWIVKGTPMKITAGIMTFTPDGMPFCGKLPGLDGFFHCAGFSGHGIVQSASIGVIMSQFILEGRSTYDVAAIEADRYFDAPGLQDRKQIESRCQEMYAGYYGRVLRPAEP